MKNFGYFTPSYPTLPGIRFGNWGSRPYEYFWAATITDVENKKVLDLGTGLPSEHTWYQFVLNNLSPVSYAGIDFDSRIKQEEINTDNCKMLWMDMSDLKFDDNSFDLIYSISTFEHFDNEDCFMKAIKETHRVAAKDAIMVVTLDELWNVYNKHGEHSSWNELEKVLIKNGKFDDKDMSFGMKNFIELVKDYFVPEEMDPEDIIKNNADPNLLHSSVWNSVVSHGVFRVVNK